MMMSEKNSSEQQMHSIANIEAIRIPNVTSDSHREHHRNSIRQQERNQRVVTGNANIRKLIRGAASREDY